jgi:heme exporter protein A
VDDHVPPRAELVGVSVVVRRSPVLRGVDLVVAGGEVVGLVGANGSGKSTLLKVLAELVTPGAGSVRVRGPVALFGHAPALYPQLTLRENLRFVAGLAGLGGEAVDEALEAVGLAGAAGRRAEQCSHGMRRRADLARALLTKPALLLLDEVHTGLDASSAGLVDVLVDSVRRDGGAAVVVSHEPDRLGRIADRVVHLVDGRLVSLG